MKNKMMRIASILLVATLLTTCAISGTFAKYVTKASGEDSARVAKWGIVLTVNGGDVFADKYATDETGDNAYPGEYSVVSSLDDKVVAPGTSSKTTETTLSATVKGTPEVATRYTLRVEKLKDVVLPKGTDYTDYTELVLADDGTYGYTGKFDLAADYAPVKWNMNIVKGEASDTNTGIDLAATLWAAFAEYQTQLTAYGFTDKGVSIFDAVKIIEKVQNYQTAVENALASVVSGGSNFQLTVTGTGENEVLELSYDFDPNKDMDFTFTLDWEWAFEQEDVELYDKADTYLGNIAAEIDDIVVPAGASTVISATVTATATQID